MARGGAGAEHSRMSLFIFRSYSDQISADGLATLLESEGVPTVVEGSPLGPNIRFDVLVPEPTYPSQFFVRVPQGS